MRGGGGGGGGAVALSLLRVINFKFPLPPDQKYNVTQYGKLGFSYLSQMKDDYTADSRYVACILFLFERLGDYTF